MLQKIEREEREFDLLDILTSRTVQLRVDAKTITITGKYIPVKIVISHNSHTNKYSIQIGIPEEMASLPLEEVMMMLVALLGHEAQHVVSSSMKHYAAFIEDCAAIFSENQFQKPFWKMVGSHVGNIVEDGRIETILCYTRKGMNPYIVYLNRYYTESSGTLKEKSDEQSESDYRYSQFFVLLWSLSKRREYPVNYDQHCNDDLKRIAPKIAEKVAEGLSAATCKACMSKCMEIVEIANEYLMDIAAKSEQNALAQMLAALIPMGEFETEPSAEEEQLNPVSSVSIPMPSPKGDGDEDEGDQKGKGKSSDEEDDKKQGDSSSGKSGDKKEQDESGDAGSGKDEKSEDGTDKDAKGSDGKDADGDDKIGNSDTKKGGDSKSDNGSDDKSAAKHEKDAAGDIDRELNRLKEEMKDLINRAERELVDYEVQGEKRKQKPQGGTSNVGYQSVSKDLRIIPVNETLKRDGVKYRLDGSDMEVARRFKKDAEKIFLKNSKKYQTGRRSGRIHSRSLHKLNNYDTRIFKKDAPPHQTDTAISIVVDMSGSMCGEKFDFAMKASAIVEEALGQLVPLHIAAFNSTNKHNHYVIKDFDEVAKFSKVISFQNQFSAGGGNKDGLHIRAAKLEFDQRREKDKFLIILSDGLPEEYSSQAVAIADVKNAINEAKKEGIKTIGIFFGSEEDRETLADKYVEMYGKDIINISPENIPSDLQKLIKELISK